MLTGGAGADTFVYLKRSDSGVTAATADRITDFSQSDGDKIDLSAVSPLRPLAFIGSAPFSGAGQIRVRYENGETRVEINLDGGSSPAMIIRLDGQIALTASDFA